MRPEGLENKLGEIRRFYNCFEGRCQGENIRKQDRWEERGTRVVVVVAFLSSEEPWLLSLVTKPAVSGVYIIFENFDIW